MDRFSSKEEVPFDKNCFDLGRSARQRGFKITACPWANNEWAEKSWRAGWSDEDMSILTELMIEA